MPTVIYTGDKQKCRQINLIECPVCGVAFESTTGVFLHSALLDSSVLVCQAHRQLTVGDELKVQEALQRALANPNGRVQKDGKLVKRCKTLEDANYQVTKHGE